MQWDSPSQGLKAEFEEQEVLLKQLEQQAEEFSSEGKTEAAERLEQQVTILKVRFVGLRDPLNYPRSSDSNILLNWN